MYRDMTSIDLETPREKLLCGFALSSVFEWRLRKAKKALNHPGSFVKKLSMENSIGSLVINIQTNKTQVFYIIDF